jgi:MFS family permease
VLLYVTAPGTAWLFAATPLFGLGLGAASTSAYTAATAVMPPGARGAGFGLLTTASLVGVAISPIVAGLLAATSIRTVFVLDVVALGVMAAVVSRLMVIAPPMAPTTPAATEEL